MAAKKILIVEDEQETLALLEKKLAERGFVPLKATTASEAIDSARKWLPDLILLDIILPDSDGSEVVKALNSDPLTQAIPILFLSGIVTKENGRITEITVGTRRYHAIPKPFTFKELFGQIDRCLNP
jgi:DNA-binding response OmpR family regulator